ncbi:MAG TPA: threonine ammonia-lyase [Syntrophales bacterium]|mgnify:CR=1 FL=1|jgi:threonine dehydratase|nr:threonine ammonia-lyase [Syntrophales bacterium]HON22601.1 threonine ammonia-lyase [Syntrophales bacterium]HOU77095.1 threonine ammonia-lyase [Syntrophales bacterium]HPC32775.1 threonine ammonia-lyase [Syntrophales bacterium]HQG33623.1 threonine ammonia-lyase [Syntrophales bacterium]
MIELAAIEQAERTIREHILATPLIYSPTLSHTFNAHIYLKLENLQKTGSFKVRGATYKIITGRQKGLISTRGVVAASAGNHAQGVALAARQAGLPATIVMPEWSSISKREATRSYGGNVVIYGATVEECLTEAKSIAGQGAAFIHPFDDREIITGQATIGLEIISALPDADVILVPVGGGGLIAGIASSVKALNHRARIIGVEAAVCPSAQAALRAGKCVAVASKPSLADGINVKQIGQEPLQIMRSLVDDVVSVAEEDIAASIQLLLERKHVLSEGAGAVPLAALLSGIFRPQSGEKVVLLISGGNVDSPLLGRIIQRGLLKNRRILRLRLTLIDKPGNLARLLSIIAELQANILHIHHDRSPQNCSIEETIVELELETRNQEHIDAITCTLRKADYNVILP